MDFWKSIKGGPFGSAGGRIPEEEGIRPPPPLPLPKSAPVVQYGFFSHFVTEISKAWK